MKKIVTLLFVLVALGTNAQIVPSEVFNHLRKVSRESLPAKDFTLDPNRSTSNISIDYDSFDVKWASLNTPPDSMYYYSWNINKNNLNSSLGSLRYAVQKYDTLVDVNNNFSGTAKAGTTVRVDSFTIYLAHENNSGLNDTFTISLFDRSTATVTGTGINTTLNTTALWSQEIIDNVDFFPTNTDFYVLKFKPNVTLPIGHTFGIRVDFKGDTLDQLYVLASYRDKCSSSGEDLVGDTNKLAPRNSSYYLNLGANSNFFNYNTNFALNSPNACKWFIIQNFLIFPSLTLTTTEAATVVTTAATSVASTTATLNGTVNANGNSTSVSFDWGLTTAYGNTATGTPSPVTGSSTTPAYANLTGLTANTTYHYRIKGINGGGTSNGADMTFTTLTAGTVCTPDPGVTSGISPASSDVPCVSQGVQFSQTYTFVIPASVLGGSVPITSVTFDSIRNLPAGLTAQFSQNPPTYAGGSTGCMLVSGTTNAACGQYQILIYVTIVTPALSPSGELSALATQYSIAGFPKNFLRVISQGGTCPAVNTSQSTPFAAGSCGIINLTATATKTDVSCFGQSTGTATAVPSGGSNYSYSWSNGGNTVTITGLPAGTYTVTVSEGNATATASVTVGQPAAALSVSGNVTNAVGSNNGSVNVTTSGGTGTYIYSWSNGANTEDISGLGAGTYTVTVTDQNACTATATYTVTFSVGISGMELVNNFNVFPNPASTSVNVQIALKENADMKIELIDLTGKVMLSENTGKVNLLNYRMNTSSVPNGVYAIRVTGNKLNLIKELTITK